jgi:MFS transporter, SP family, general alpha glucoside:H+ symporter
VGIYEAGWALEKYGYKKVLIAHLCLVNVLLFLNFFASDVRYVIAGESLLGMPWGAFQAASLPYAADVSPAKLRGPLTTFINMCW